MWRLLKGIVAALVVASLLPVFSARAENAILEITITPLEREVAGSGVPRDQNGCVLVATLGRAPCILPDGTNTCTRQAAVEHTGLPKEVQEAFLHMFRTEQPRLVSVPKGEHYEWMQYRNNQFLGCITTAFPAPEGAQRWILDWPKEAPQVRYVFDEFAKCCNLAFKTELPPPRSPYPDKGLAVFECPPGTRQRRRP